MRADFHPGISGLDEDAGKASGEGLFIHVRVPKHPFAENFTLWTNDFPTVSIMGPAAVGVANSGRNGEEPVRFLLDLDLEHVSLACRYLRGQQPAG